MAQINETTQGFWIRSAKDLRRKVLIIFARMAYRSVMETASTSRSVRKKISRDRYPD